MALPQHSAVSLRLTGGLEPRSEALRLKWGVASGIIEHNPRTKKDFMRGRKDFRGFFKGLPG